MMMMWFGCGGYRFGIIVLSVDKVFKSMQRQLVLV